jgi:hypothetical protein
MQGTNENWNLPRRKCDDCGKTYKPKRPLLPGTRGFCCANCRKSYHKHGGAYRKLKGEMHKMVERQLPVVLALVMREYMPDLLRQIEERYGVPLAAPPSSPQPRA